MSIFISNIPYESDEEDLIETLFINNPDINVRELRLITDRETGRSKGFAFLKLNYDYVRDAGYEEAFVEDNQNLFLNGRKLNVMKAKEKYK